MPFQLTNFASARPWLFHLTSRENLNRIRASRILQSSTRLRSLATNPPPLNGKRKNHLPLDVDGEAIFLRDQAPLHQGNMRLLDGWTFQDVIDDLNNRIFFWPGRATGPISYGIRHFERYEHERPIIIRISSADLFAVNSRRPPEFCRFNSGSPRCSGGVGSPRGAGTFVTAAVAEFTAGKVVEVTFRREISLPRQVEIGNFPLGPWRAL
jgi:hypothetical protein